MNLLDVPPSLLGNAVTLRDCFAASALQGLLATVHGYHTPDRRATFTFEVADAMLRVRGGAAAGDAPSLRDHFAMAALRALCQSRPSGTPGSLATRAYTEADAMLQARALATPA